jgi:hypothetical protein
MHPFFDKGVEQPAERIDDLAAQLWLDTDGDKSYRPNDRWAG